MNVLDIVLVIIVVLCAFRGYRAGLIRSLYRLVAIFIAIFLAYTLHPPVAGALHGTGLHDSITSGIQGGLNLGSHIEGMAGADMTAQEVIGGLPMPAPLRDLLDSHFSENVHGALDVSAANAVDVIEGHIAGFFATIALNIIAIILVFVLVIIILLILGRLLDIVGKLPVINTFNRIGGLAFGFLLGLGIAWLCVVVLSMFFATGANSNVYDWLENSFFASSILGSMMPRLVT